MDFGQYAVNIDKAVPNVAYGPVIPEAPGDEGTILGYFHDLEVAKVFTESARTRGEPR